MATAASPGFTRDQRPAPVPIWREGLAGLDWLALRASPVFYGCGVPRGNGSAAVLVPGFLGTDWYLLELYGWLARLGYRPYLSRIGRNAECLDVLSTAARDGRDGAGRHQRRVHLIGHSLGGMLARSLAARRSELVASVVTLGSPFRGVRSHPLVLLASDACASRCVAKTGRLLYRLLPLRGGDGPRGAIPPRCRSSRCTRRPTASWTGGYA